MVENLESSRGLVFSQRVLLALIERGMSREAAYDVVQRNAMRSWDECEDFRDLIRGEPEAADRLSAAELDELFDYAYFVRYVDHVYRRVGLA